MLLRSIFVLLLKFKSRTSHGKLTADATLACPSRASPRIWGGTEERKSFGRAPILDSIDPYAVLHYVRERLVMFDELIVSATLKYLAAHPLGDVFGSLADTKRKLMDLTNFYIEAYNDGPEDEDAVRKNKNASHKERFPEALPAGERLGKLRILKLIQVAMLIQHLYCAVDIVWQDTGDDGNFDVGLYQWEGEN